MDDLLLRMGFPAAMTALHLNPVAAHTRGLVDGAGEVTGKPAGRYTMRDVLGLA